MSQGVAPSSVGSTSFTSADVASHFSVGWVTQFLKEMQSALPYKRRSSPVRAPTGRRQRRRSGQDWETLICQMSIPLTHAIGRGRDLASCRMLSRTCCKAFSLCVGRLVIRDIPSGVWVTSLMIAFKNATSVVVMQHTGALDDGLRFCTQLRELSIEPLHSAGKNENHMSIVGQLTNLERLKLWGPIGCTATGFRHFSSLSRLTSLSLGSKLLIDGSELMSFASCPGLKELELMGCRSLDDRGIWAIAQCKRMTKLRLSLGPDGQWNVTESGFSELGSMHTLDALELTQVSPIADLHFCHLLSLTRLSSLRLDVGSGLGRLWMLRMDCLTELEELSLKNLASIGNRIVQSLSQLMKLTSLSLGDCVEATDDSITALSQLPKLTHLTLLRCPWLTHHGLESLLGVSSLKSLKVTGVYSISGDELHDITRNNNIDYDTLAWKQQIILLSNEP